MGDFKSVIGDTVKGKDGEVKTDEIFVEGKVVGLYFSAHWCPPCQGFTPMLAEFYEKLKGKGKAFEVIFISSDEDEAAFTEYYASMPWLALPFSNSKAKENLEKICKIDGIPTLFLIDGATGLTINKDAYGNVEEDPNGENFPWQE